MKQKKIDGIKNNVGSQWDRSDEEYIKQWRKAKKTSQSVKSNAEE